MREIRMAIAMMLSLSASLIFNSDLIRPKVRSVVILEEIIYPRPFPTSFREKLSWMLLAPRLFCSFKNPRLEFAADALMKNPGHHWPRQQHQHVSEKKCLKENLNMRVNYANSVLNSSFSTRTFVHKRSYG